MTALDTALRSPHAEARSGGILRPVARAARIDHVRLIAVARVLAPFVGQGAGDGCESVNCLAQHSDSMSTRIGKPTSFVQCLGIVLGVFHRLYLPPQFYHAGGAP
jgi:hypothetical protein